MTVEPPGSFGQAKAGQGLRVTSHIPGGPSRPKCGTPTAESVPPVAAHTGWQCRDASLLD